MGVLRAPGCRDWWRADLCPSAPLLPGELKDPSRAIPLGTIVAVTYTFFIYTLLFFLSSFTCDRCLGRGPAWPLRGWSRAVGQGCHIWITQGSKGWGGRYPRCRKLFLPLGERRSCHHHGWGQLAKCWSPARSQYCCVPGTAVALGLGVEDGFLINLYFHKYLDSCADTVRNVHHVIKPKAA